MITELTLQQIKIDHLQNELKWALDYRGKNYDILSDNGKEVLINIAVSADLLLKMYQEQYKRLQNEQTIIS